MEHWFPKKFTHKERLQIANKILEVLKDRYKKSLVSVAIEGSTAKGLDAPESDLELRVLLDCDLDYHRWYAFFFEGMFVGISYNSYFRTLEESKEIDYEWSISGDNLDTAIVIFDPSNVYDVLNQNNEFAEQRADFKKLITESVTDMYEHIYKVFTLSDNDYISLNKEVTNIAYWAALTVGLANRVKYKSNKSMVEESFALKNTPSNYEKNIRNLFLNENLFDIKNAVSVLWPSFVKWVSSEFEIDLSDDNLSFV
ncbi:hypothetical protein ERJ70_02380 [Sediminibacillus dalangtanensis]|uniref:Kanamycin nucleotidyltransferase C-terminal domain-containing protein n=1 Tax=Sediminibacillus dalangtanensis TaxID=2729421 RepID=A0ABX7VV96_9BACI|nr:kanamycin nucleotidyltransferase C-terminal domain-containing protein [Sediminibacillus dalangtanensis]QTM98262.1 hypothetical protein ERJ70_02380 [Sediminibacillus dalangtanensis]